MMAVKDLGDRIRRGREARGMTVRELAGMSRTLPRTVLRVEGGGMVADETYRDICVALDIPFAPGTTDTVH